MAPASDINRLVWPEDGNKLAWLDRAKVILDVAARAGTMFLGYQAFEKASPGSGLAGAIISQIAMKLATADNMVSGGAGVATLTTMGILNVYGTEALVSPKSIQLWMDDLGAYLRSVGLLPPLREEFL